LTRRPPRSYLLEVTGTVTGGQLELGWTYPAEIYDQATVARLAEGMISALGEIVEHCAPARRRRPHALRFPAGKAGPGRHRPASRRRPRHRRHLAAHPPAGRHAVPRPARHRLRHVPRPGTITLDGVSDPRRPRPRMAAQVIDRTPVLRASIAWEDVAQPVQVIHRQVTVPVTHHDWRDLPGTASATPNYTDCWPTTWPRASTSPRPRYCAWSSSG